MNQQIINSLAQQSKPQQTVVCVCICSCNDSCVAAGFHVKFVADVFVCADPVTFVDFHRSENPQITSAGDADYYLVFLRENLLVTVNGDPLEVSRVPVDVFWES